MAVRCFTPLALVASWVLCGVMSGCATQRTGLYQWGSYDQLLYQSYQSPEKVVALRTGLETHIARQEKDGLKVPPGVYAELGTLYLQAQDSGRAVAFYIKERDAWPESRVLMDALIQGIERRQQRPPQAEAKP